MDERRMVFTRLSRVNEDAAKFATPPVVGLPNANAPTSTGNRVDGHEEDICG
ncbi:hypothetical protein [Saccharothrix xinjiangensis]|uniref:Uncharacterized protein n=1 Tax=Saccharothrix xinjiangensis TaxID=204798 RepID=A0ABV9Y522_9PSEU